MIRSFVVRFGLVVVVMVAVARPASAAETPAISIEGGVSSLKATTPLTVRYTGYPLYERLFIQQCWAGDGADFDFSVDCDVQNQVITPLIDKTSGSVTLDFFVGDEPTGSYDASCGPKQNASNREFDTCYVRVVPYSMDNNAADLFIPIAAGGSATPAARPTGSVSGSGGGDASPVPWMVGTAAVFGLGAVGLSRFRRRGTVRSAATKSEAPTS